MASSSLVISAEQHATYLSKGYTCVTKKNSVFREGIYSSVVYTDPKIDSIFGKILGFLSSNPSGMLFNKALTDKYYKMDYSELGFDPDRIDTVVTYVNSYRSAIQTKFGHKFLPYHRPKTGISCFIFLPYGNLEKAEVQMVWNGHTGQPHDSHGLIQAATEYCATYRGKKNKAREVQTIYAQPTVFGTVITEVTYQS